MKKNVKKFIIITATMLICSIVVGICGGYIGYDIGKTQQPEFMRIAQMEASGHTYKRGEYDCRNYSADLVNAFEKNGYEAHVVSGWISSGSYCKVNDTAQNEIAFESINNTDCGGAHEWVEVTVPIEAITGELIER